MSSSVVQSFLSHRESLRGSVVSCNTEQWQMSDGLSELRLIGGVDVSFDPHLEPTTTPIEAAASLVVCQMPRLNVVYSTVEKVVVDVPYIPGLLAMREGPILIRLMNKLRMSKPHLVPQVLLVDGNGQLHPDQFGLASQLGVELDMPTIGAAKNLFQMDDLLRDDKFKHKVKALRTVGEAVPLKVQDQLVGLAVKTSVQAQKPIFVSIGHRIDLQTAKNVIIKACLFRVPEPIRQADFASRQYFRRR